MRIRWMIGACAVGLLLVALGPSAARAAILLYEPWDYPLGETYTTNTAGTPSNWSGGIGFDSAWETVGIRVGNVRTIVAPLDFSDYDDTFGSGNAMSADYNEGSISRPISVNYDGSNGPLWGSFLFRSGGTPGSNSAAMVQFSAAHTQTYWMAIYDLCMAAQQNNSTVVAGENVGVALQRTGALDDDINESAFSALGGSVYLFLSKASDTGGDAKYDQIDMWVLDPAGYDALKAGGHKESDLDLISLVKISDSLGQASLTDAMEMQLPSRRHIHTFDEIRYATTLPEALGVPEPATLSLIALGGVGVALRRRKRR